MRLLLSGCKLAHKRSPVFGSGVRERRQTGQVSGEWQSDQPSLQVCRNRPRTGWWLHRFEAYMKARDHLLSITRKFTQQTCLNVSRTVRWTPNRWYFFLRWHAAPILLFVFQKNVKRCEAVISSEHQILRAIKSFAIGLASPLMSTKDSKVWLHKIVLVVEVNKCLDFGQESCAHWDPLIVGQNVCRWMREGKMEGCRLNVSHAMAPNQLLMRL